MNLVFIRKVDKGTLWRMTQNGKPWRLRAFSPKKDNREPNNSEYILMIPGHLKISFLLKLLGRPKKQVTIFYLSDESGAKGAYRGFALTRDLDRAKQEFENQLGHRGAIEANSKGL